jgi:hypothetical protein
MGRKKQAERATALALALAAPLVFATLPAAAEEPAGQELIVTRVERGRFPAVKLWLRPTNSVDAEEASEGGELREFVARPGYVGTPPRLRHPRNVRNLSAYYLEPGDHVYCEKAKREAKTNVWVLDGIQRVPPPPPPKVVMRRRPKQVADPLEVRVATDKKSYRLGEPVRLILRAKNRSEKPLTLVFPSGETHQLVVTDGSMSLWRLPTIEMVSPKVVRRTLKPGETIEFTAVWDQKREDGKEITPGRYLAGGKLMSEGRTILEFKRVPFLITATEKSDPTNG